VKSIKELVFEWEGKDKNGKVVRGELRSGGEAMVNASLRRQGIMVTRVRKRRTRGGRSIKQKDIAVFTRQLSTMMRAGVPLIQAFDIVARGSTNPKMTKLLIDIREDVETGTSLSAAFRKHPLYFDALYCNLVEAGEAAGILETLLDRLATYQEKTMALKNKIKSALVYPVAVLVVAFVVLTVIMIFVIPAFEDVFKSFGADLPAPTLLVIAMSKFFVSYWWAIFGILGGGVYFFMESWKRSAKMQMVMDRLLLRIPVDDVRRWRSACGGARFGRRRRRQRGVRRGHRSHPTRRHHRFEPKRIDADDRSISDHGAADVRHRRRVWRARPDARQGSRVLRG
jgi:type IV pilus assembly protein PilC